jgi:DNA polymerase-1
MTTVSDNRLYLLDAYALIYRAYFAFAKNPRITSTGMNTSAIFGFTNTLLEIIAKEKPTHIAVVFDTAEPTERHETFTDYKANRDEVPEDIIVAVPFIKKILEGFDIPVVELPGYEADDLIGTMAKIAEKQGYKVFMVTPDKDYAQLVSENIFVYRPARMGNEIEIWGVKEVCEKFEIENPLQVIDFLGMMGDAVDNIPGLPGVGEKTAKAFIKEFGSMENLLANTDKIKGKLREKIESAKDLGILSKKLATIIIDAPITFDWEQLKIGNYKHDILKETFDLLEFRTLARRFLGEESAQVASSKKSDKLQTSLFDTQVTQTDLFESSQESNFKTIANTPHHYEIITEPKQLQLLISKIKQTGYFCFDTETTGIDARNTELVGVSLAIAKAVAYYIPFNFYQENNEEMLVLLGEILTDSKLLKIGQNLKFDIAVFKSKNIEVSLPYFDTMIAHYLIQPDMKHNMDALAEHYLQYSPVSIETLIGKKGKEQGNMAQVPLQEIKEYAAEDADITLQLYMFLKEELKEAQLEKLFFEIEMPLLPVLIAMEACGIKIDTEALAQFSIQLADEISIEESKIYEIAGSQFNIASPKQLGEILFDKLKIDDKVKKTKTGQYSTKEETLQKYTHAHPIIEHILNYRGLQKLKSTYVDALPQLVDSEMKIHTSFNQAVAATGRLSSNNPNLQNIPIKTERGKEVRKAFIASNENFKLLSADYSQVELRIIAALSKEQNMIEAFKQKQDIHAATAAKIYGISLAEVTPDQRRNAKMVNFGIIYGISAFGLSQRLNIARREASEIIESYFATYPKIKTYMDSSITFARENGYVETILGRRRYLRDINSQNAVVRGFAERNAINAPIQGSAADIIKKAMIDIHTTFKKHQFKSKMLLQVHDELIFDAHLDEIETIKPIIIDKMMHAVTLEVPLDVEAGIGNNWLDAH